MLLNAGLNVPELALQFQRARRLVIPDVLAPSTAEQIHDCLTRDVKWGLAYRDAEGTQLMDRARLDALSLPERSSLEQKIHQGAQKGFQYKYRCYPMLDAYLQQRDPGLLLHRLFEFINSPVMLDFARAVTGFRQIVRADAQATLYAPGDFLTLHNDFDAEKGRLAAYVMGFSKGWRADYGGMLQFLDAHQNVEQGFLPRFNSLMLFAVPQMHAVTCVAPFAPIGRYAVTGWFQDATGVPASTRARFGM